MAPPSGEQFELRAAGYRAVVTEAGATLRVLEYDGRPLVDGFAEDELCHGGRGQLLMPWPGRVEDHAYLRHDPSLGDLVARAGATLIGYRELRELARS